MLPAIPTPPRATNDPVTVEIDLLVEDEVVIENKAVLDFYKQHQLI